MSCPTFALSAYVRCGHPFLPTMPLPPISIFLPRGQCIILLFAALRELEGRVTTQEAIQFISDRKWFAIEPDDMKPYPSQQQIREARWKTLIAWGRKDAALRELVLDHEYNSWALSREGIQRWESCRQKFATGELNVSEGYLWSPAFKCYLFPCYEARPSDAERPWNFYTDIVNVERLVGEFL